MLDIIMVQVILMGFKGEHMEMIISQAIVTRNQHTIMNSFLVYLKKNIFERSHKSMDFFDRFAIPHPSPAIYASMVAIGLTVICDYCWFNLF